jgi:Vps16, C-terminal region
VSAICVYLFTVFHAELATRLRFWWIKLQGLVETRDWEELEKFAKSKKSPIGYEVCEKQIFSCSIGVSTKQSPFLALCTRVH